MHGELCKIQMWKLHPMEFANGKPAKHIIGSNVTSRLFNQLKPLYDEDALVCDGYHTRCFANHALTNMTYKAQSCKCLPSCTTTQVSMTTTLHPSSLLLDFCEDDGEMGYIYINDLATQIIQTENYETAMKENSMKNIVGTNFSNIMQTCQRLLKDEIAIVKFQLTRTTAMRVIQDVKVNFSAKVGVFGKPYHLMLQINKNARNFDYRGNHGIVNWL